MAMFRYEAVDKTGKVLRGVMDAASEQAVQQRLVTMGYSMKAVLPASAYKKATNMAQAQVSTVLRPSKSNAGPTLVTVAPVVPLLALVRFYRQLATMVKSGMPLIQSMDDLYNATRNNKLKQASLDIKERVQRGDQLSAAMAAYPKLFPVWTVGLIWGGELGGYLDIALDEAAAAMEQEHRENRFASIGWYIFKINMFFFVLCLPLCGFGDMLAVTLDSQNASMTSRLQGMAAVYGKGFVKYSIPAFIGWIIVAYFWGKIKRIPSVRRAFDGCLLAVPLWGNLHRARSMERFLRTLQKQYQAGVAPASSWAAAATSVRNSELASRLRCLDELLRKPGGNLSAAFSQSGVFPPEDAGMIGTGEKSGTVPEMLQRLADLQRDTAAGSQTAARFASIVIFNLGWIIPSGIAFIMAWSGYGKLLMRLVNEAMGGQ